MSIESLFFDSASLGLGLRAGLRLQALPRLDGLRPLPLVPAGPAGVGEEPLMGGRRGRGERRAAATVAEASEGHSINPFTSESGL